MWWLGPFTRSNASAMCQAKFYDPENQQEEIYQVCMFFASVYDDIAKSVTNARLQEIGIMFTRGCAARTHE